MSMRKGLSKHAALAVASLFVFGSFAWGQSGTRQPTPAQPTPGQAQYPVALRGYCPVCLIDMKQWVAGHPDDSVVYDGHLYRFPAPEQMQMFQADPAKYTPVLHGDCIVCLKNMGQRIPGDLNFGKFHEGRVYFFPSDKERQMFVADPATYKDADLAFNGNCVVCQVEMNQVMPGKPEFTAHHQGLRYLFPGAEQRNMFLAHPRKYAVNPAEGSGPATDRRSSLDQNTEVKTVSVQGRTSCAGCEHGVKPLGAPDELGLAVVTEGDQVYIIEDAHKLYPKIYEERFQGQVVKLTGTVLQERGSFVWVRPDDVRVAEPAK